jgi:hypothetical protein
MKNILKPAFVYGAIKSGAFFAAVLILGCSTDQSGSQRADDSGVQLPRIEAKKWIESQAVASIYGEGAGASKSRDFLRCSDGYDYQLISADDKLTGLPFIHDRNIIYAVTGQVAEISEQSLPPGFTYIPLPENQDGTGETRHVSHVILVRSIKRVQ